MEKMRKTVKALRAKGKLAGQSRFKEKKKKVLKRFNLALANSD
jgi:hypothetical protein